MEFDNVETMKQAIGINAGVSILPRPTVLNESGIRTLVVAPLALPGLVRPIGIIHRRGRRLTPVVARFIDQLQQPVDGGPGYRSGHSHLPRFPQGLTRSRGMSETPASLITAARQSDTNPDYA